MKYFTEVQNMNGRLPHLDNAQARDDFDCVYIFRKVGRMTLCSNIILL